MLAGWSKRSRLHRQASSKVRDRENGRTVEQEIQIQASLWTFALTGEKEQEAITEKKLAFQGSIQITAESTKTHQS